VNGYTGIAVHTWMTTDWSDDVNVQNCHWADKIKETRNDG